MESTRTIIASSLLFLAVILAGCAAPQTKSVGPGEGLAETEDGKPIEIGIPSVDELPEYSGAEGEEAAELTIEVPQDPRKMASFDLTQQGKAAMEQNDYASASKHFESAIKVDPHNGLPYYYRALLDYRQGSNDEALGNLGMAKVRFQDAGWKTESHIMSGRILEEMRRWETAEAEYSQAVTISPGNQRAIDGLRRVQSRTQSLEALEQSTAESDESPPSGY